jgi:small subunit ribosomal protein S15
VKNIKYRCVINCKSIIIVVYLPTVEQSVQQYIKIINKINVSMYLTREKKEEIFAKHGESATNTGSSEGQIALFTFRINHLTEHLKRNRKDFNTERSLVRLVGKRRNLLDYLIKTDIVRYREVIKELGIRK